MRNMKWIGMIAAAAMIGSLTACGGSAEDAQSAQQGAAVSEETADAEAVQTAYAYEDESTGYVIRDWVGSFQGFRWDGYSGTLVFANCIDEEKGICVVEVRAVKKDLPEDFDTEAEDAEDKMQEYQSEITFPYIFYSADETVTEEDMKAAYEKVLKEKAEEVSSFSDCGGMTMYQFGEKATVSYSENATEQTRELFESLQQDWEAQRAEGQYETYQGASGITFQTVDYDGNEVDESVFGNAKITMVNIWATSCSPCIGELPELQKLNDQLEDVQVITILADVSDPDDDDAIEEAHDIAQTQGMTLPVLLTNEELEEAFKVTGTPTSYLVDENGNIVGRPKTGAPKDAYGDYAEWIQQALENL